MLDRVVSNGSVFRCALKVVMVAEIFVTGDREFETAGAIMLNALDCRKLFLCRINVADIYTSAHFTFTCADRV